jgi:subtilisin family serine protease
MQMRNWIGPGAAIALLAALGSSVAQSASSPRKARKSDRYAVSDAEKPQSGPLDRSVRGQRVPKGVALPGGVSARLAQRGGKVAVMIELAEAPAAVAYGQARSGATGTKGRADSVAVAAARSRLASIERAQQTVLGSLRATDAQVLYRVQKAYNGIAARVNMRDIPQIRRMPGVKSVQMLVPMYPNNWNSVPFIGAPTAWTKGLGYTGEGIKVGVIDTGIDYLHANFGGPGFFADYAGNDTTVAGDAPNYPGVKVAGGYDFVGDDYDANDPSSVPQPDDDPMDCNGHGSHVAGTIGGYGVDDIGDTFGGPYGPGTNFNSLIIGPGVAPKTKLYALRVFGCDGSTNVTTQAIDWAVDPNGDGDFSDHLDVVNMSLGSSFGSPEDSSAVASENAAFAGVLVVASAGNSGDTYYITGSPAVSGRTISVAASLDKAAVLSGLDVNSPPAVAGTKPASEAAFGPDLTATPPVTGDLAVSSPLNGCTGVGSVSGQIALIDRGGCTFKTKVLNAQAAGTIGVVITNSSPAFPVTMGDDDTITTPITIPSMMIEQSVGNSIRAAITGGATVNVTLTGAHHERIKSIQTGAQDVIASFSSRGASLRGTALKPDIDSVGETVFSTQALFPGTEGDSFNGTSMSAPHVAGTMAILRQLHPTWTVEELKALVMNTANHDVFLNLGPALPKIGPGRIGAGRQDVAAAVNTNVVAYNGDGSGRVSVSFGSVEVAGSMVLSKPIVVKNRGGSSATYTIAYNGTNMPDVPGVAFTTSGGTVTVAPGATATFNVVLTADAASMKHSRDASVASAQATGFGNFSRHFVSEEAGYVTLTPATGPVLRVPVYAAARPASAMGTALSGIDISTGGNTGTRNVNLTGTGVNTGSSFGTASPFPGQDEISLVSVFELQEISDRLPANLGGDTSGDLQYIGVAKTNDGDDILNFGIATYENWSTANPNDTEFDILIDTDRDGNPDFLLFNWDLGSATGFGTADNYFTVLVDLNTGDAFAERRLNGISPGTRDSVTFNNRVMALSAYAVDTGITGAFDYWVESYTRELGLVDVSEVHTYDISAPGLSAPGSSAYAPLGAPVYDDLPGNSIPVSFDRDAYNAAESIGLLLLHHHNASGTQAQAIDVASAPQPKGDFNGDGKLDLLWRDQGSTGEIGVWFMDGATQTGVTLTTPGSFPLLNWEIVGVGDFNGDGQPDFLWRDTKSTGQIGVWFMNGTTQTSVTLTTPPAFPLLQWKIVGVGDFNGDGKPDIAWRDQGSTGQIAVWLMDGTILQTATLTNPNSFPMLNWEIVGVADFNGDGKPDFLWRDTQSTGQIGVWYMDGANQIGVTLLNPPSFPLLNWQIQAVGDFDGDGKPDIVWRNQAGAGEIAMWFMDGVNLTSATLTNPPNFPILSWRIVGPK